MDGIRTSELASPDGTLRPGLLSPQSGGSDARAHFTTRTRRAVRPWRTNVPSA